MRPNIAVSRLAGSPNLIFRERLSGGIRRQMNDWSRLAVGPLLEMQKLGTESDCPNNLSRPSDAGTAWARPCQRGCNHLRTESYRVGKGQLRLSLDRYLS